MDNSLPELPEINVTPLVDVMLVLVVLLLMLAPMIGRALPVDIPKVAASNAARAALPKLELKLDGSLLVDGIPASDTSAVNIAMAKGGAVLYADKALPYEKVAKVLSLFAASNVALSLAVGDGPRE